MTSSQHDPTSLGNLAKIFRGTSDDAIDRALEQQGESRIDAAKPLGEVLVESGVLMPADIESLLSVQKTLRGKPRTADVFKVVDYAVSCTEKTVAHVTGLLETLLRSR